MPHSGTFHQGLLCLRRQNQSSENLIQDFLDIITCDPSIYIKDHPDFIVCSFMEDLIDLKRDDYYSKLGRWHIIATRKVKSEVLASILKINADLCHTPYLLRYARQDSHFSLKRLLDLRLFSFDQYRLQSSSYWHSV